MVTVTLILENFFKKIINIQEIRACNKILDEVLKQRNNCDKAFKELRDLQEDVETKRQILREIEKKEQVCLMIL